MTGLTPTKDAPQQTSEAKDPEKPAPEVEKKNQAKQEQKKGAAAPKLKSKKDKPFKVREPRKVQCGSEGFACQSCS